MEKIHITYVYFSANIATVIHQRGSDGRARNKFGGEINAYKRLLENPEGKRPNEGPRCGWEIKEIKCGLDSTGSEQGPGSRIM